MGMLTKSFSRIGEFLAWWRRELAGVVPRRLRRALRGDRGDALFCFDGQSVRLAHRVDGRETQLKSVDLTGQSPTAFWRDVRRSFGRLDPSRVPQTLRIPSGKALRKKIELPLAAEENLSEVVAFEMDRRTPFRATDVYYDQRVVGRDTKAGKLNVELLVAPRRIVEAALAEAAEWRIRPYRLEADGDDTGAGDPLDLLPPDYRATGTWSRTFYSLLLILALGLLIAAVAIPLEQNERTAARLKDEVRLARAQATEVEALRVELATLTTNGRTIVDQRTNQPLAIAVIAELTRLLPDDSWVFQVRLDPGEVQVHGYAAVAAGLIERFEKSELLEGVRFRSPVTRDGRVGLERFHLSATVLTGDG